MIIKVGQQVSDWVLISILPERGTFINLKNFNRYDDEFVRLHMDNKHGVYADVNIDQYNVPPVYFKTEYEHKLHDTSSVSGIRLFRHLRPFGNPNDSGVTFAVDLDYDKNEIRYHWSICNKDNFEKKIGRHIASDRLGDSPKVIRVTNLEKALESFGVLDFIGDDMAANHRIVFDQINKVLE